MDRMHDLARPMAVTVHGELGLVEGEVLAIGEERLRFWCREDLLNRTRHDLRVDVGMNRGNADLEVVIRSQDGAMRGRRGFLHTATWRAKAPRHAKRLSEAVQAQLPDVWLTVQAALEPELTPVKTPRAAPSPSAPGRGELTEGLSVTVAQGSTPSVAVMATTPRGLRAGVRLRGNRAVARIGRPAGIEEHDRVLLVLSLPNGTFHQSMALVTRGRGGLYLRSDPLPQVTHAQIARALAAAGVG